VDYSNTFGSMQAHLRDQNDLYQPQEPIDHNLQKPSATGSQPSMWNPVYGHPNQGRPLPTASQNVDYSNGFLFHAGSSSRSQRFLRARRTNQPRSTKKPAALGSQPSMWNPVYGDPNQGRSLPTASQNEDYSNTFGSMQAHLRDHNDFYEREEPINHDLQKNRRPWVPSRQCGTQCTGIPTKVGPYRQLVKTWLILTGFRSMQAHLRD
jgi:hypothetical protein